MDFLNIVIPCHNEENNIVLLYDTLVNVLSKAVTLKDYNIIFIDDGSTDKTLQRIKTLSKPCSKISYLSFTRNFGKEAALLAGIKEALKGPVNSYTVFMDADLQDPPALLLDMIKILEQNKNIECVAAKRITRKGEPPIRSFFSRMFYKIYNLISEVQLESGARDFCMIHYEMLLTLAELQEISRFSKGLFTWTGFHTYWLEYENISRTAGKSNWSFWKLFKYAVDGIVSFSPRPLELSSIIGFISCLLSGLMMIYFVFEKLLHHIAIQGYAMLVCLILLLGGIQLLCIGILGEYLAKVFLETKKRPPYVIRESGGNNKLF